uniref:60S acidic ribosomal protein P0 n=1 Tax=Albugo laibachii Nc14 TaxID=890382 RepID=F0WLB6_9STRA|nr:60S acidic ribosomal protein P0 putative [Albugo laibachii Nc14]|eukprot:CCA22079.1 60S acidic ribosomal protein P0 putative [Albugo laibachii Nc14]
MGLSAERKQEYFVRLESLLETFTKIFLVSVDNVRSKQMQQIRQSLRGRAEILMGKNTLMRKVFGNFLRKNPNHPLEMVVPLIRGNIGFVFTNDDLNDIRSVLESNRVPAPARVGAVAPADVVVPPGSTGCDPGQTSFFQALQIATKIQKGQIEIVSEVLLIKEGEKVGNSEAALLQKLNINPFSYGLVLVSVYDNGSVFDPAVLDLTEEDLFAKFIAGLRNVAAVSLEIGIPTLASIPHSIANAFKSLVAVAVECETYSFEKAEPFKAYLADPSAFAVASSGQIEAGKDKKEEKAEVEEEEMDLGGGMDMFGADDDDY